MKVLIADDDELSRRKLEYVLRKDNYILETEANGRKAFESLASYPPPVLAILDVLMPGMDGIEICRRLRVTNNDHQPYIILLTVKTSKDDIVAGLEAGANDYIMKPFDAEELRARVRVGVQMLNLQQNLRDRVIELETALARVRQLQGLLRSDQHTYEFGPFRIEASEQRLTREGRPIPLTAKVFDLLLLLIQNSGHLVNKEEIMREVWHNCLVEDNNLTVSMSVLRKALGEGSGSDFIETVPKRGYRFVYPVRRID